MLIAYNFANLPIVTGVKIAAGSVVILGDTLTSAINQVHIAGIVNRKGLGDLPV
jgi:hypothetical protein